MREIKVVEKAAIELDDLSSPMTDKEKVIKIIEGYEDGLDLEEVVRGLDKKKCNDYVGIIDNLYDKRFISNNIDHPRKIAFCQQLAHALHKRIAELKHQHDPITPVSNKLR